MGPLESHIMTFLRPTAMSSLMIAVPAAPGAAGHDFDVLNVLAHNLEGVEEARKRHHGGPVLVVMKDRAFEDAARLQAVLNLKAFWGLDVLKVHAAERGGHKLHQFDNLGGILGVHAQRGRRPRRQTV